MTSSSKRIAVVTGANRGLGAGIVQVLATTPHPQRLIIYATSRSGQPSERPTITPRHGNELRHAKLDVADPASIAAFLRSLSLPTAQDDGGARVVAGVDILINNAVVSYPGCETYERAVHAVDVNYRGVRDMCALFLREGGMRRCEAARIVNLSSAVCALGIHSEDVQKRFRGAGSVAEVDGLADEYLRLYREEGEGGWVSGGFGVGGSGFEGDSGICYQVSKACVNALTRVLAQENPGVLVNCCCPGWVDSDTGRLMGKPPKTLEEGAAIPVKLAVGDIGQQTGNYWANGTVFDQSDGQVQIW